MPGRGSRQFSDDNLSLAARARIRHSLSGVAPLAAATWSYHQAHGRGLVESSGVTVSGSGATWPGYHNRATQVRGRAYNGGYVVAGGIRGEGAMGPRDMLALIMVESAQGSC
jgi:hypothetical protein